MNRYIFSKTFVYIFRDVLIFPRIKQTFVVRESTTKRYDNSGYYERTEKKNNVGTRKLKFSLSNNRFPLSLNWYLKNVEK